MKGILPVINSAFFPTAVKVFSRSFNFNGSNNSLIFCCSDPDVENPELSDDEVTILDISKKGKTLYITYNGRFDPIKITDKILRIVRKNNISRKNLLVKIKGVDTIFRYYEGIS